MRIAFANGKYSYSGCAVLRWILVHDTVTKSEENVNERRREKSGRLPTMDRLNVPRSVHASMYGLAWCAWSVNRRRSSFFRRANHAWPLRGCSFLRNCLSCSACGGIFVRTTWTSASNTVEYVFPNTQLYFLVNIGGMRENLTKNVEKWGKMYNLYVTRVRKKKEGSCSRPVRCMGNYNNIDKLEK